MSCAALASLTGGRRRPAARHLSSRGIPLLHIVPPRENCRNLFSGSTARYLKQSVVFA